MLELLGRALGQGIAHQGIRVPVTHEDRRRLVDVPGGQVGGEALMEKQPRRQAYDAGNLDGGGEAGEDAHRAALGEAAEDDAVGGDARRDLILDEAVEEGLGLCDAGSILVDRGGAEGVDRDAESFLSLGSEAERWGLCVGEFFYYPFFTYDIEPARHLQSSIL